MAKDYVADYHMHTNHSSDSRYKMEQVVKDAIRLGLDEICFTDHTDYRGPAATTAPNFKKYFAEIESMQRKYGRKIAIKKGLEFGMQTHTVPRYLDIIAKYPLDFVILSVHQINNQGFWAGTYQRGKKKAEYVHDYYQEILSLIQMFDDYSVLGHLDLIRRYCDGREPVLADHRDIIVEILETVIKKGKGIDLNTSHIRYGLADWMPARDILALYHDLGGKVITVGSDSHHQDHLGFYIKEGRELLKEIGFTEFCTFDRMQPKFHKL
ncbi:MAG: histidinol-phosphatase HisJ family protein [Turicibacter sp.]|nr:histidinol-phosphatase HisJ family protein [Turicibacter sp.]